MKLFCQNMPTSGPIERRIGYADGYARRNLEKGGYRETALYKEGYTLGEQDRTADCGPARQEEEGQFDA